MKDRQPHRAHREIERYCFDQFALLSGWPLGEPEYTDQPDVICRGERAIGVEIASLFLVDRGDEPSEEMQRKRQESTLARAQREFLGRGGARIEVTVAFDPLHPIADERPVAWRLASGVLGLAASSTKFLRGTPFRDTPEVHSMYYNSVEYEDSRWRVNPGRLVPRVSTERVRELILDKESKLSSYQRCDEYWLLLVVDAMDAAQEQDVRWPRSEPPIESVFERVVIFDPKFGEVSDVPLRWVKT